jgi:hypothetical protein
MADPNQRSRRAEMVVIAWQLAGTWSCGSLLLGTVALVFLHAGALGSPLPIEPEPVSLTILTPWQRLTVFALVAALFVALGVIGWRTAAASWLTGDTRARLLWTLVVGAGGLAGWGFAAAVTFAAQFGSATQLILAYLAGGLPFALTAAMLVRPWRVNVAAVTISVALVGAGYLMVAGNGAAYPQNVFALYADYLRSLFGGGSPIVLQRHATFG